MSSKRAASRGRLRRDQSLLAGSLETLLGSNLAPALNTLVADMRAHRVVYLELNLTKKTFEMVMDPQPKGQKR